MNDTQVMEELNGRSRQGSCCNRKYIPAKTWDVIHIVVVDVSSTW